MTTAIQRDDPAPAVHVGLTNLLCPIKFFVRKRYPLYYGWIGNAGHHPDVPIVTGSFYEPLFPVG